MRSIVHRSWGTILVTAVALGAAQAGAQRVGESGGAIDTRSGRFTRVFESVPVRAPDTLAVTDDRAFAAMPAVFAKLAIPLTAIDSSAKAMGAVRVPTRHPVAGERLSRLLECGIGTYGPNAESYSVQLTLVARATAIDSTHTEVQTVVVGIASPNGLSSSLNCGSTGRLEERFVALLRKELGL
jgi:hypothetical protein